MSFITQTSKDIEDSKHSRFEQKTIFADVELKATDDELYPGGLIEGHASIFDNVDLHEEIVKPGAFAKTIKENKAGVYLLDSHKAYEGTSAVIGRTIELKEDKRGLFFRAKLSDTPRAQEIRQKIKEGILDKMSFGFQVIKEQMDRLHNVRELLELKLLEISVVVFPANPMATITGAKHRETMRRELSEICQLILKTPVKAATPTPVNPRAAHLAACEQMEKAIDLACAYMKKKRAQLVDERVREQLLQIRIRDRSE